MAHFVSFFTSSYLLLDRAMSVSRQSTILHDCEKYHTEKQLIQEKIFRYNSLEPLIIHLTDTMIIDYPNINYPSIPFLNLILAGTQITEYNTDPKQKIPDLSSICVNYLNSIFDLLEPSNPPALRSPIYELDLESLRHSLSSLFSFLDPPKKLRGRSRFIKSNKSIEVIDSSPLSSANSSPVKKNVETIDFINPLSNIITTGDIQLSTNKRLYGNTTFDKLNRNPWDYFIWSFKCSSFSISSNRKDTRQLYKFSWKLWKNFISLILRYFELELSKLLEFNDINILRDQSKFWLNILNLSGSSNREIEAFKPFIDITFTKFDDFDEIQTILESDLRVNNSYVYVEEEEENEFTDNQGLNLPEESKLGIESIELRKKMLILMWHYLDAMRFETFKEEFLDILSRKLRNTNFNEFIQFFTNDNKSDDSKLFLKLTFQILSLIDRSWNIDLEEAEDSQQDYFGAVSALITSLKNYNNNVRKMISWLINYQIVKLSYVTFLNAEELALLSNLPSTIQEKSLGDIYSYYL